MREIGFQRTYIFKIFRGSMPPDPPRKVRLRRTITFSVTYEHPLENLSYAPANAIQNETRKQSGLPNVMTLKRVFGRVV